jgi:hypothetical protein
VETIPSLNRGNQSKNSHMVVFNHKTKKWGTI